MKDVIITIVLAIIMLLNFLDVLTDISLGVPLWHIIQESLIVLASGLGAVYLLFEIRRRASDIKQLKVNLEYSNQEFDHISNEMKNARSKYGEVIANQFEQWQLTKSERDVAMLLLKGLSFREISGVRETKEKTVRQQASNIYEKAKVEGRHEFSAWFFEDFIN